MIELLATFFFIIFLSRTIDLPLSRFVQQIEEKKRKKERKEEINHRLFEHSQFLIRN
jgi:hypothetical protein